MDFIYDPESYLLGFRITFNEKPSIEECEQYYIYIKNYLKAKDIPILANIAGLHLKAKNPHIHIHFNVKMDKGLMTNGKRPPKNWLQNWKYYWASLSKLPDLEYLYQKQETQSKLNISIQGTWLKSCHDLEMYFAYTLKEGNLLPSLTSMNCIGKQEYLREIGEKLYQKAQANIVVKEKAKVKQLSIYKRVIDRIDNHILRFREERSLYDVCYEVLEHFRELPIEEQIAPDMLVKYTKKHCYYIGIWTTEEILEKYI